MAYYEKENYLAEVLVNPNDTVVHVDSLKQVVLVDIDGTLADCTHRQHLIARDRKLGETAQERTARKAKPNWREFFAQCDKDTPIETVCEWVRNLPPDYEVICVSGRSDECRDKTEKWLVDNRIPAKAVYMRRAGDYRPDDVVKEEILYSLPFGLDKIAFVIDDRSRVVTMWRRNGLTCYQVADGDF